MPTEEIFNGSETIRLQIADSINAVRQNHALEHATITLLLPKLRHGTRLVGRAGLGGFYLKGDIPTELLEETAYEALRRLQEGDEELAVTPMCGTNHVMAGLAAGVASTIAARGHRGLSRFRYAVMASIAAILVAQPLGRLVQKHITTRADLENVSILQVTKTGRGTCTRHKVEVVRR